MRISDWSSDVCSSDLDFASEQRLFAGRHLHFAVIAEALAELAGLGIDGDQAVVERAEEDARLADRAIGGGGVNPVRDAATLLVALDLRLRIVGPTRLAGLRVERDDAPRYRADPQIAVEPARLVLACHPCVLQEIGRAWCWGKVG